ncbi:MAG: SAF domain-containing protein, partial [Chloroflexota bacterium]
TNNNPFSGGAQSGPTDTPIPTPTPITLVNIVIAVQELPRGFRIPANAVTIRPWPEESVPFNAVLEVENVVNKIARTDIFREQPILSNMLVDDFENLANDLARVGSDAAAILPDTLVAIAMPVDRITSVAYAVQDGDRVDVIVSMLFVDVDEAFQSIEPSNLTLFTENEDGGIDLLSGVAGRPDTINIGSGGVIISPSEPQRPRLLTQRTIQDALVVKTGEFPIDGRFIGIPPTPTPVPVEDDEEAEEDGPPPPTPVPPRPDILTLGLTPQDAVLLVWAIEARLPLTLALRSATDTRRVPTEPVTLDYFMSEYRITVPAKRDYSIEPAIRSIRQLDLTSSRIEIGAAAPAAAE